METLASPGGFVTVSNSYVERAVDAAGRLPLHNCNAYNTTTEACVTPPGDIDVSKPQSRRSRGAADWGCVVSSTYPSLWRQRQECDYTSNVFISSTTPRTPRPPGGVP
eukprot:PhM_4_TR3508/c0_g1_i1/m.5880